MRRLNIAEMKINDGVNSQLSISRSDRQDSGLYKCVAENSFGKSEHLIYLAVQGKFNIYSLVGKLVCIISKLCVERK